MSIPLDRLYHYIEDVAQDIHNGRVLIYHFFPHGSKNINDLIMFGDFDHPENGYTTLHRLLSPYIYCHDQEPLNYDLYKDHKQKYAENDFLISLISKYNIDIPTSYFPKFYHNIYDYSLLLHSEQRSSNLIRYQQDNLIPVYYWSHALISLDWFRCAQHFNQHKKVKKTFLIYNRAWSGTREYRLKFSEQLIRLGLETQCQTSINPIEPELKIHYNSHHFKNSIWKPELPLEDYFPISDAKSHYSADFNMLDYEATNIEVVLETLFDDERLHLTEKILRPIACGQPFILAGTHRSLEYLRGYGFKTFEHIWDEQYDRIENPEERLRCITDLMKQIANWTTEQHTDKIAQAREIAEYNRQHFFSQEFFNQIIKELRNNLESALSHLEEENLSSIWFDIRKKLFAHEELRQLLLYKANDTRYAPLPKRQGMMKVVSAARKYYLRSLNKIKKNTH